MSEQENPTEEFEFEEVSEEYVSPLASGDVNFDDIEEVQEVTPEEAEKVKDFDFESDFDFSELSTDEDEDFPLKDFTSDEIVVDDETPVEGVIVEVEDVLLGFVPELTVEEAQELTEHIRSTADMLYVLVARAHAGKAHIALGYKNFEGYVKEEFGISRSRAYQFLNQSKVIAAIEAVAPEGTQLNISEAVARDLKKALNDIVPEIESRTSALNPDEAGQAIEEYINEYRDSQKEEKEDEFDLSDYEKDLDEIGFDIPDFGDEGGSSGGGSEFDDMDSFDNLDEFDGGESAGGSSSTIGFDDSSVMREKLENVYAFYTAMTAIEKMPSAEEIIASIQESRRSHINTSLPKAKAWIDSMYEAWFADEKNKPEVDEEFGHSNEEVVREEEEFVD